MRKKDSLVQEVKEDFENRKSARRNLEIGWLLNINFLIGNQNTEIVPNGEIIDTAKQYYWQEREVYNHIAPIIESRLSKFGSLKCNVAVRPATNDIRDVNGAKFSTKLLKGAQEDSNFRKLTDEATFWSEVTGTAFYKISWNKQLGRKISASEDLYEGDLEISVCPPYEIFPDNLSTANIDDCKSIIHARVYSVQSIEDIWGVKVEGKEVDVINMDAVTNGGGYGYRANSSKLFSDKRAGQEVVIERYSLPDKSNPNGRLTIVAGDKLLYDGQLPYINRLDEKRGFPFVKQICMIQPASFFGGSILSRMIPIQRAYNSIKNRKHEYLNRIAMGVMMVEDGSVDLDNLEEEGLAPGKVLVYRQGSNLPVMMNMGSVPDDFREEEDRLLKEFVTVSGVSDFLTSSTVRKENMSGIALNLIMEQDNNRLSLTSENIRSAIKEVGKHILRLYKQFATTKRLKRVAGDNGEVERISFVASNITSDDVVFEVENEIINSLANRKAMAGEILKMGLLYDENGKMSDSSRLKLLEIMGFGNWESALDTEGMHHKKAQKENLTLEEETPVVLDVDDHEAHIEEHVRYLISADNDILDADRKKLDEHIRMHKRYARVIKEAENIDN